MPYQRFFGEPELRRFARRGHGGRGAHRLLRWDQVVELGDVIAGRVSVPDFSSSILLFESQGIALEDVAIANQAYELARKHGKGREIQL